ncbi:unnamed protein product [Polarella glacialis]|uniref:Uncharacterized protein n=1 Tax=Polarella glacialis TaxID=89957 RepID=A0A813HHG7_POLGL|nr:unnamed protein product [Polarella glacialis]
MGKEKWGGHRAVLTSNWDQVSSEKITKQQEPTNKTQHAQQRKDQRRPAASKPAAMRIFVITKRQTEQQQQTTQTATANNTHSVHEILSLRKNGSMFIAVASIRTQLGCGELSVVFEVVVVVQRSESQPPIVCGCCDAKQQGRCCYCCCCKKTIQARCGQICIGSQNCNFLG